MEWTWKLVGDDTALQVQAGLQDLVGPLDLTAHGDHMVHQGVVLVAAFVFDDLDDLLDLGDHQVAMGLQAHGDPHGSSGGHVSHSTPVIHTNTSTTFVPKLRESSLYQHLRQQLLQLNQSSKM